MYTGTVKWYMVNQYGYIKPDNDGQDVFVNERTLRSCGIPYLEEGAKVMYQLSHNTDLTKAEAASIRVI